MKTNSDRWGLHCSAIWRYMPGEYRKSMTDIAAELEDISASSYQAVQITAPYANAGYEPWWGCVLLIIFLSTKPFAGLWTTLPNSFVNATNTISKCSYFKSWLCRCNLVFVKESLF